MLLMEKINSFDEVMIHLNEKEIVFLMEKGIPTFFAQISSHRIRVNNDHVNYFISYQQMKELFENSTFYLYDKGSANEENISEEKDREYYSWQHK